jgi:hypothetical protein
MIALTPPMKKFVTDDGRHFLLPGNEQRPLMTESPWVECDCLKQMGNDFYFLPLGSCLRPDKTCNNPDGV